MLLANLPLLAQRNYANRSVLADGNWYKIGVVREGVYRIDGNFLQNLGVTSPVSSAQIRLYGNGGGLPTEDNGIIPIDDLFENAIQVFDGGDGVLQGTDFFLFYAPGPHQWKYDSIQQRHQPIHNIYSDTAFYFLRIGGNGKRIAPSSSITSANTINWNLTEERIYYQRDSFNFLSSGQEWWGEELSTQRGNTLNRTFSWTLNGMPSNSLAKIQTRFAGRSVGNSTALQLWLNGQLTQQISIPAVSGFYLDQFARVAEMNQAQIIQGNEIQVQLRHIPGNNNAQVWVQKIIVEAERVIVYPSGQASWGVRHASGFARGQSRRFSANQAPEQLLVWDITNSLEPSLVATNRNGNTLSWLESDQHWQEFRLIVPSACPSPIALGTVANQNLHGIGAHQYVIVSPFSWFAEANRLANFHRNQYGYSVAVVPVEHIFNEFGGGQQHPIAIRDFLKMQHDRFKGQPNQQLEYVLLLGAGSFDYKNRIQGNTRWIPTYQSRSSLEPLVTHTTDDFFGFLDDNENINNVVPAPLLDVSIGRIPAKNISEAKTMIDKIIAYHQSAAKGSWRLKSVYVADDEDLNIHLRDAEFVSFNANNTNPLLQQQKIYLDAFRLQNTNGLPRFPDVNEEIVNQVNQGALFVNYSGHGSFERLAEEAIFSQTELNRFNNTSRLPLFITATCDFAPHDDPTKISLGNQLLVQSNRGGIALLTTTRPVFAFSNRIMNDQFLAAALKTNSSGKLPSIGAALRTAKNITYSNFGDIINNRKFTLLGDPAMQLAFPALRAQLTSFQQKSFSNNDTLKSLQKYTIGGEIKDVQGNLINNFNGRAEVIVFDRPTQQRTLGNKPTSPVATFTQQQTQLFRGQVTVLNGKFECSFRMPAELNIEPGRATIQVYAEDSLRDAVGSESIWVSGNSSTTLADNIGPKISLFLNDTLFRNGGLTNERPILIAKLFDTSGIQTTSNGIGKDILLTLNNDERNAIVLNDIFIADIDSYQSGSLQFQLPILPAGKHSLTLRAWDIANNSSTVELKFVVGNQDSFRIARFMNYPNPMKEKTTFSFEHNRPNLPLETNLEIYHANSQLVYKTNRILSSKGTRLASIQWDGKDGKGRKLPPGTYFFRIIVVQNSQKQQASGQLIVH